MKMIVPLLSARWVVKVVSCDCVSHITPMVRHSQPMCISGRCRLLPYIQMDGAGITVLTAPMQSCVIVMANGQEMTIWMVFAKPTSIRLKAYGQRSATFYAHFAVFIGNSSQDILLFVNLLLISSLSLLNLYQNLSNALNHNMSQCLLCSNTFANNRHSVRLCGQL